MNKKLISVAIMTMFLAGYGMTMAHQGNADLATAPTFKADSTTTNTGIACTDTDTGSNYFAKGSVLDKNRPGTFKTYDKCVSGTKLLEYSCKNDSWYASYYECEFGCSDGACKISSNATATTDTTAITDAQIGSFIDAYLSSVSLEGLDLTKIDPQKNFGNMTADQIKAYLDNYLSNLNFANAKITDEEGLQKFLDSYLAGLRTGSSTTTTSTSTSAVNLPDGTLIKLPGDEKVYIVEDGMKEWIETAEEFTNAGYDWGKIQSVDAATLASIQDQIRLIKDQLNKVYEILGDQALWIPNEEAFAAEGYDWADVENTTVDVSTTYEEINILEDQDGNLYYITSNGKKQLITNQDVLDSLAGNSTNSTALQLALDKYLQNMLTTVAANPATETEDKVALQQAWEDFTSTCTNCTEAAWENYLANQSNTTTAATTEAQMEQLWQEYLDNNSSATTTTTGSSDWEAQWEQYLASLEDGTSTTTTATSPDTITIDGKKLVYDSAEDAYYYTTNSVKYFYDEEEKAFYYYDATDDEYYYVDDTSTGTTTTGTTTTTDTGTTIPATITIDGKVLKYDSAEDAYYYTTNGVKYFYDEGEKAFYYYDATDDEYYYVDDTSTGATTTGTSTNDNTITVDGKVLQYDSEEGAYYYTANGVKNYYDEDEGAFYYYDATDDEYYYTEDTSTGTTTTGTTTGSSNTITVDGKVLQYDSEEGAYYYTANGVKNYYDEEEGEFYYYDATDDEYYYTDDSSSSATSDSTEELDQAWEDFEADCEDCTEAEWEAYLEDYEYTSDAEDAYDEYASSDDYENLDEYCEDCYDTSYEDTTTSSGCSTCKKTDKFLNTIDDVNLIQEVGDFKVYEIVDGYKNWITTAEEFQSKGYEWNDIVSVNPTVFGVYEAYSAHR